MQAKNVDERHVNGRSFDKNLIALSYQIYSPWMDLITLSCNCSYETKSIMIGFRQYKPASLLFE